MAQVSIQATGRAGGFFDLDREDAVTGLAVAFHRRTPEGAKACVLPASHADLVALWNATRPKPKGQPSQAVAGLMGQFEGGG